MLILGWTLNFNLLFLGELLTFELDNDIRTSNTHYLVYVIYMI